MADEDINRIVVSSPVPFSETVPPAHSGEFPLRAARATSPSSSGDRSGKRADQKDVRAHVERLMLSQRLSILRVIGRLTWFGVLPVMGAVGLFEVLGGRGLLWISLAIVGLVVAGLGAVSERLKAETRGVVSCVGFTLGATASLFQFGPTLSIGFFYVAATLVAAMLLRSRPAYGVAAALWGAVLLETGASMLGLRVIGNTDIQLESAQWLRLALTSGIGTFALLYLFLRIQSSLWDAVEGQMVLRASERRLVEERETVLRAASSAQRLESLGRLAGGIAHDFNNSLVVIQCSLEALREESDAEERAEVLREVSQGVERAAATARQLLSFAKRNVEEIGKCDAGAVALQMGKDSKRMLPASIRLSVETAGHAPVGLTASAVEQLLMTFIQNAREALGQEAGEIVVRIQGDEAKRVVLLEVRDDGPGMNEEVLSQACEPFFTTRGENRAGLGLSTAWGIVHRQSGDLVVESELGRGTRVIVTLPMAAPEPSAKPRPKIASRVPTGEQIAVLVLEDEVPVRTAFRRILKHAGLIVVEAGTVAEARAACETRRFSLLISDGVLPDGGVGHFIQEFRRQQRAPVILCSGYTEEDLALDGVLRGECSFLPKPFSAADLNNLVGKLLEKRASASS